MPSAHEKFMQEALSLAIKGQGFVSPNPMVGAVVLKAGKVVGRGWHKKYGGPHAEVFALRDAGEKAKGSALYCTLEPCNHTGKTPPCVQAILKAGISTVFIGALDPNPTAAGGVKALRAAGVKVVTGICEWDCERLNAPFFKSIKTGLPFVSLKWAMSADGKIATASGDSKWITGKEARAFGHVLRARHDAVLVGIATLLKDGSQLTVRNASGNVSGPQPRRVILDGSARTPLNAPLWDAKNGGQVIVITCTGAPVSQVKSLQERGAEVIELDPVDDRLPTEEVLRALAKLRIQSVLVEGGSRVLGSFIDARLGDRAYVFIAPRIIGGRDSVTAVAGAGAGEVSKGLELVNREIHILGQDVLISGALSPWGK